VIARLALKFLGFGKLFVNMDNETKAVVIES